MRIDPLQDADARRVELDHRLRHGHCARDEPLLGVQTDGLLEHLRRLCGMPELLEQLTLLVRPARVVRLVATQLNEQLDRFELAVFFQRFGELRSGPAECFVFTHSERTHRRGDIPLMQCAASPE